MSLTPEQLREYEALTKQDCLCGNCREDGDTTVGQRAIRSLLDEVKRLREGLEKIGSWPAGNGGVCPAIAREYLAPPSPPTP